jgi:hypothetical protein
MEQLIIAAVDVGCHKFLYDLVNAFNVAGLRYTLV